MGKKPKMKMPMNFNMFGKGKPLRQPRIFDTDGDGVPDLTDCAPYNKNKHGKVSEWVKKKWAESKQKRAYEQAAAQQRQKVAQAEYYRAKEEEAKKLARYRAEQERKKAEERYKYTPRPQPKPGQPQQRQGVGSVFGGLNVPPARDMFGNLLYPERKQVPATTPAVTKKKRKKRGKEETWKKQKRKVIVYV